MQRKRHQNEKHNEDSNNGGSYRESYGGRGDKQEDNYSNERGGWESDRSGHERDGYGRPRNYGRKTKTKKVKG